MGGSQTASSKSLGIPMESQDYRGQIRAAILAADETANIVDPLEMGAVRGRELGFGEGKPSWTDDADVRKLFAEVVDAAAAADVVVSYLPTASMGSPASCTPRTPRTRPCSASRPARWRRTGWCARSARGRLRTFRRWRGF